MTSNALEILVVLAQDCSEQQLECYKDSALAHVLRPIIRRGCMRMRLLVVDLLYQLASSPAVINNICTNGGTCDTHAHTLTHTRTHTHTHAHTQQAVYLCVYTHVDNCPLLYAYELLSNNSSKFFSDSDIEYGLKVSSCNIL